MPRAKIPGWFIGVMLFAGGVALIRLAGPVRNDGAAPAAASLHGLAPDFTLATPDGGSIALSAYRGRTPVLVDSWASRCPNRRRDTPTLNALYQKYSDRLEVIGVNLREDPETVRRFVEQHGIAFPVALDSGDVADRYGIRYTNTHFLIDADGRLVRTVPGDIRESDLAALL